MLVTDNAGDNMNDNNNNKITADNDINVIK
jgi:hypothetical protein